MKIMKHRPVVTGRPVLVLALLLIGAMSCLQAQNIKESDIEVVYIPSGSFTMGCTYEQGSDCSYDEKPSHQVHLGAYAIAKYEVTQKLWKAVMGNNPSRVQGDDLPVHNVTWEEVQTFIARLNQMTGMNYRLPTEAEWEYAARGGAQAMSSQYSGNADLNVVGWYSENSESKVHPVGLKQPNALGLYDMSGNVWEWCNDVYGFYSDQDQENPQGPEKGVSRVTRGGCYAALAKMCRTTARKSLYQGGSDNATGFRLAFTDDREARAAEKAEQERIAAEEAAARAEEERIAAEKAAEEERIAAEKAAEEAAKQAEKERIAAEKAAEEERIAAEKAAAEAAKQVEKERVAAEKAAEEERVAAEKAAAEAAKKAEKERVAAEKTAAHDQKVADRKERLESIPSSFLFTVNGEVSTMPQWGAGFKIGTMKNVGWYFSALSNFNYKGIFHNFRNGDVYNLTGNSNSSYVEALIGITARRYKPVSFHFGVGFNYRSYTLETTQGWFSYPKNTYYGPAVATGLMFHIHSFVFSLEGMGSYNLNPKCKQKYAVGGNFGIGFCIPTKKNK